ncbi:MAG: hypothetical protein J6S67_19750 [Methanobrevibacter sp.]|nr:hypothetical protein [Methanobrevibacter sp.]
MNGQFNTIFREGKRLDMMKQIEDLQEEYIDNLNASIETNRFYASDETYNDCLTVKRVLYAFYIMGYLYHDEYEDMCKVADDLRLIKLKELENEGNC